MLHDAMVSLFGSEVEKHALNFVERIKGLSPDMAVELAEQLRSRFERDELPCTQAGLRAMVRQAYGSAVSLEGVGMCFGSPGKGEDWSGEARGAVSVK